MQSLVATQTFDFFRQRVSMDIQEEGVIETCVKISVGAVTPKILHAFGYDNTIRLCTLLA